MIKLIFVPRKVCIWSTPKVLHIVFSNANAFGSKSRSPGCAFKPFFYIHLGVPFPLFAFANAFDSKSRSPGYAFPPRQQLPVPLSPPDKHPPLSKFVATIQFNLLYSVAERARSFPNIHQNRSISLFPTPFDHFHFHPLSGLI